MSDFLMPDYLNHHIYSDGDNSYQKVIWINIFAGFALHVPACVYLLFIFITDQEILVLSFQNIFCLRT